VLHALGDGAMGDDLGAPEELVAPHV